MSNFLASNLTLKRLVFTALAIVSLSITIDLLNAWGDQKQFKAHRTNNNPSLKTSEPRDSIPQKSGTAVNLYDHEASALSEND